VADLIGPTVLAQGPAAGRRCAQIRLGGCNLSCVWCDAASTWGRQPVRPVRATGALAGGRSRRAGRANSPSLVVITGGEPLLQQR